MPLIDGISRKALEARAIKALIDARTMAFDRVYSPRSWPTKADLFPAIIVQTPVERKVAIGRGIDQFNAYIRLVAVGRVWRASEEEAQADIDLLSGQIEEALLCNNDFSNAVQQFTTIETTSAINTDSRNIIGDVGLAFECEVYQVYGPVGVPLVGVDMTITNGPGGAPLAQAKVSFPQTS